MLHPCACIAGDSGPHSSDSHDQTRCKRRLLHCDVTAVQAGGWAKRYPSALLPVARLPALALIGMLV